MNTKLRKKSKNGFSLNCFFKLMNNTVFVKIMNNVRKHIKLVTKEKARDYLVPELNYHTTKFFTEDILAIKMKKNRNTYE